MDPPGRASAAEFIYIRACAKLKMPAKRKRDAIQAQLDELDRKYQSKFEEQEKKNDKLERELQQQGKRHTKLTKKLQDEIANSRSDIRSMGFVQMLNTYLNILKFAIKDEPDATKERRDYKKFRNNAKTGPMIAFIKIIYPDRLMSTDALFQYFKGVDSFKVKRDRLIHPRGMIELREDAHRFSALLESHKQKGDPLTHNETLFLDVFSKIDELCSQRIGNLHL